MSSPDTPIDNRAAALRRAYPELGAVAAVAGERPVYLVGGAVRDLLLDRGRTDLDLAVVGDPGELAAALGAETLAAHERFGTVKVVLDGHELDLAAARTETYERPGALPTVAPADSIEADLARRDFTVNAMAVPLADPGTLLDPHSGRVDLEAGLLRVLHPGSFVDDPTRAIRAARYAARFGFALEPETEVLLRATDFSTISAERREAELLRLAGERDAPSGLGLLAEWGVVELQSGAAERMKRVEDLYRESAAAEIAPRELALLAAAFESPGGAEELAGTDPAPAEGVELAARRNPVELVLAMAMGASWIGRYWFAWRRVELELDGDDLIAAGIPAGPAIGRGLQAALRAKLEGQACGRDEELAVALAAAREP